MTPDEIYAMAKGLQQGQAIWYILWACIGGAIAAFGAYGKQKGKNLADKEDIAAITREVENVKNVFNRQMEDLKAHHQLRTVAAERRMQTHQDAFEKWLQMCDAIDKGETKELSKFAYECQEWWKKNIIFLGPKSRIAFNHSYVYCLKYCQAKEDPSRADEIEEIVQKTSELGAVLVEEVDLPPLSSQLISHLLTERRDPQ